MGLREWGSPSSSRLSAQRLQPTSSLSPCQTSTGLVSLFSLTGELFGRNLSRISRFDSVL